MLNQKKISSKGKPVIDWKGCPCCGGVKPSWKRKLLRVRKAAVKRMFKKEISEQMED